MAGRVLRIGLRALLAALAIVAIFVLAKGGRSELWIGLGQVTPRSVLLGVGAASLAAVMVRYKRGPGSLLLRIPPRVFAALIFAAAFGTSIATHFLVHKGVPQVPDELGYLHTARTFADGRLYASSPPLREYFYVSWGVHDGGKWYAVFPPGYSLVLAGGVAIHLPWIVNPLLGATLAVVVWSLARLVFDRDSAAARLAPIFYLGSWFRLMQDGSFMAHPLAALLASTTILAVWKGPVRRGSRWWSALAGGSLALLVATRQLDGALITGIVIAMLTVSMLRRRSIPGVALAVLLATALPIGACYLAYNRALTGDALLAPQQRYMQIKERTGDCFRLGFGPGIGNCPLTQETHFGPDGFQPRHALINTKARLHALLRYSFGWIPLIVLAVCGLVGGAVRGRCSAGKRLLCAAVFGLAVAGYALFFYDGVTYGARFYYFSFPFLAILMAAGASDIADLVGRVRFGAEATAGLSALLVVAILLGVRADTDAVQAHAGKRAHLEDGVLDKLLRSPAARGKLVFVDSMVVPAALDEHPTDVVENDPLVVRDFGDAANAGFARLFPGRPTVRLVRHALVPLHYRADAPLHLAGGAQYPLDRSFGGFGDRVTDRQIPGLHFTQGSGLRFTFAGVGGFDVPLWMIPADAGRVTLAVSFGRNPRGPTVALAIDGHLVEARFDTSGGTKIVVHEWSVTLAPGAHTLQIYAPEGTDGATFLLDSLELRPSR